MYFVVSLYCEYMYLYFVVSRAFCCKPVLSKVVCAVICVFCQKPVLSSKCAWSLSSLSSKGPPAPLRRLGLSSKSASSVPGKFRWLSVLFCKPVLSSESEPVLSS